MSQPSENYWREIWRRFARAVSSVLRAQTNSIRFCRFIQSSYFYPYYAIQSPAQSHCLERGGNGNGQNFLKYKGCLFSPAQAMYKCIYLNCKKITTERYQQMYEIPNIPNCCLHFSAEYMIYIIQICIIFYILSQPMLQIFECIKVGVLLLCTSSLFERYI